MSKVNACPRCDGLGRMTSRAVPCVACRGSGEAQPALPPGHRCYECGRPEDEFAQCRLCNPELRD